MAQLMSVCKPAVTIHFLPAIVNIYLPHEGLLCSSTCCGNHSIKPLQLTCSVRSITYLPLACMYNTLFTDTIQQLLSY